MARKTATPEVAPVMECCFAHSFDDPETGAPMTVPVGVLVRADNPLTQAAPSLWVEHGTPDDERPKFDHGTGGVQTTHKPQPSGWRRAVEGGGKAWDEQD
jgi:hypothetical protein